MNAGGQPRTRSLTESLLLAGFPATAALARGVRARPPAPPAMTLSVANDPLARGSNYIGRVAIDTLRNSWRGPPSSDFTCPTGWRGQWAANNLRYEGDGRCAKERVKYNINPRRRQPRVQAC